MRGSAVPRGGRRDLPVRMEVEPRFGGMASSGDDIRHLEAVGTQFDHALMHGAAGEPGVSIMCARRTDGFTIFDNRKPEGLCPSRNAKARPDFRRVFASHHHGVVCRSTALAQTLGTGAVNLGARVYEHSPAFKRKLRSDPCRVEYHDARAGFKPGIAAGSQQAGGGLNRPEIQPICICFKLAPGGRDTNSSVVEE